MKELLNNLSALKLFVWATFLIVLLYRNKDKKESKLLLFCVLIGAINEFCSLFLENTKFSIRLSSTIYIILINFFWLSILQTISNQKKLISVSKTIFLTFAMVNLLFIEGYKTFNTMTFIFGSFLYLIIFIYDSYLELKKENLTYFTANSYLLLIFPILYFIVFSFIFGFKNSAINHVILFNKITLYHFISYFANLFYCVSILYYIYKENKLKNG